MKKTSSVPIIYLFLSILYPKMAKHAETKEPQPTISQFIEICSSVNIGTKPPSTIAVNTSFDKSRKYFAKVSLTVLFQLFASFLSSCCLVKFPTSFCLLQRYSFYLFSSMAMSLSVCFCGNLSAASRCLVFQMAYCPTDGMSRLA